MNTTSPVCDGQPQRFFGVSCEHFPYTFLAEFAAYIEAEGRGRILYLSDPDEEAVAPVRLFSNRLLSLAQWLSPPLRAGCALDPSAEERFVDLALLMLRQEVGVHRIIQPLNHAIFQRAPLGSRQCEFGTYGLELAGRAEADVFGSFHQTHRYEIRRALRDGYVVRTGAAVVGDFYQLYSATMRRGGLSNESLGGLQRMMDALGVERTYCGVTYSPAGVPQGGIFLAKTACAAYYLYGGAKEQMESAGAAKLAHWDAIRTCLAAGVKRYDFVGARLRDVSGTKLGGIQQFKSRFGTSLRTGRLWKADLSPARVALYERMNEWRTLLRRLVGRRGRHVVDIIDQEREQQGGSSN